MRNGYILWHAHKAPQHSINSLVGLETAKHILSYEDVQILVALLRYNFLTPEQAQRLWLWPARTAQYRLARLYRDGLAARGSLVVSDHIGRPRNVYSLTRTGFDVLLRQEHTLAVDWADDWRPKNETGSQKVSVIHELGRNDVCISMLETARALGLTVSDWEGSRESTQKFLVDATHHEWQRIEPDAVILLDNWQPLLIEYERSGRDTKFHTKVRAVRSYLIGRHWQNRYPREPWVVYAIPPGTGTQGLIAGSYGGAVVQAGMTGARHYVFLDEDAWTNGTWMATLPDGTVADFWDVIRGKKAMKATGAR